MNMIIFKQGKKPMKTLLNTGVAVLSLSLVACGGVDLYQEGTMSKSRAQVQEKNFNDSVAIEDVSEAYLVSLARHYNKYGSGLMDVVVTYDARSYRNTAMKASEKAEEIKEVLRANGVRDLDVGVLPVKSQGDHSRMVVGYEGYVAAAPKECDTLLPGFDGDAVEEDENYKLGCTIETMLTRQVSRPADLMGQGKTSQTTDGRSATNIVDTYRTGAPLESLEGEQASGE
jgi:type IV pilus biogenesis protein CpaD/CtpE